MAAKILVLDIETQRAIAETWSLFKPFIPIDCVQVPSRVLCFAAKWRDEDEVIFHAAWDEDKYFNVKPQQYRSMLKHAYDLLNEADYVVTWNGDRFDLQWLEAEFGRLELGRPDPYRTLDLIKTNRKWFRQGLLSMKLDWTCRMWLKDRKVSHSATDLWWDIRHGTPEEKAAACELMEEYNRKDTTLTGRVFERYLPWIKVNLALHEGGDNGLMKCCKCGKTDLHRRGYTSTDSGLFQLWRCKDPTCNATSKDPRRKHTTELRPV